MINKNIIKYISAYSNRTEELHKLIVTAFVKNNKLNVKTGKLSTLLVENSRELELFSNITSIEDIINIFELVVPDKEQTTNGAIYTPKYIRDYIVKYVLQNSNCQLTTCLCADIACGCGAFLYTLAQCIYEKTDLTFADIIPHIYGVDISPLSIERSKILLSLAALLVGEEIEESSFKLYASDSLAFEFLAIPEIANNGGFDIIVGNPPYVRSKNIDTKTKENLSRWETTKVGNPDLYIPFFELGYTLLNPNGHLGYITVNSFFKSVNARELRKFFSRNKVSIALIDFGQQLVFKKKLAYTCLAFLSRRNTKQVHYIKGKLNDIQQYKLFKFYNIDYSHLDDHRGWNLNREDILNNINKIEQTGCPLGNKYVIKNGIATLANRVYIFRPIDSDDMYFYLDYQGKKYRIEKEICKDIIKPNIIKRESEVASKAEKIIFPYSSTYTILSEDVMQRKYPYAYEYLQVFRRVLEARDKGKGDYGKWYAFGRNQAIMDTGKKLLFPYMSDSPHFVFTAKEDLLIYCGYAIYHNSEQELLVLKKLLESSIFNYYIRNTSKPYSTGYYSYAKNYVKSFGVYPFTDDEKKQLLELQTKNDIDNFIAEKYDISL